MDPRTKIEYKGQGIFVITNGVDLGVIRAALNIAYKLQGDEDYRRVYYLLDGTMLEGGTK